MKRTPGVNLIADEAEFAGRIFDAFGEERFTLAQYFTSIERSRYQRMPLPGQNQQMRKTLERYAVEVRALLPAPGPRGGAGWKLNPAALPAIRRRRAVLDAKSKQQVYEAFAARARERKERPAKLRQALADRLRKAGLGGPVVEECLGTVDAIVVAEQRARRI
jgi:hypothetical protein